MATENKPNPRRLVIGPVRLSYLHLAEPVYDEEKDEKYYRAQILVPKKDRKTLAALKAAIIAGACQKFTKEKARKLLKSPQFKVPIRDPEAEDRDGKEYDDMVFFNTNTLVKFRPGVLLKNGHKLVDPDEINEHFYSGVWAHCSVSAFGFDNSGSKGVAFALNNVIKYKDDDRLDGMVDAEDELSDLIDEDADVGLDDDDALGLDDDDDDDPLGMDDDDAEDELAAKRKQRAAAKRRKAREAADDDDDFDLGF
jgi:hypothetical protein